MYDIFSSFQAFSYFHFLVNEKEEFDIYKVFRQYDTGNICGIFKIYGLNTIIIQIKVFSCPTMVLGLGIILQ
jgi:hypothetical protein